MFERFSREARWAVGAAIAEARRRGDDHVGSEHILLGATCVAEREVGRLLLSVDDLRAAISRLDQDALESTGIQVELSPLANGSRTRHLPFTGGAKEILEHTLKEAVALGHRQLGPLHILLAITRRPVTDPAIQLLEAWGVSPTELRSNLLGLLRRTA